MLGKFDSVAPPEIYKNKNKKLLKINFSFTKFIDIRYLIIFSPFFFLNRFLNFYKFYI